MLVRGRVSTVAEIGRQMALLDPALLPGVTGLAGGEMADGQRRDIPRLLLQEELEALLVHDVAMFNTMGPETNRLLNRLGIGSMGHDFVAPLMADGKGGP